MRSASRTRSGWRCLLLLVGTVVSHPTTQGAPSRATIEQHRVREVAIKGRFAVVRLPIGNGVKIWNPTAITQGPDGVIYVANFTGEIFTLRDSDGDGLEDVANLFADVRKDQLRYPTSLVFRGRELFVGTPEEIHIYADTDDDGRADVSRTFFEGLPANGHQYYWTAGLCFGPDGWLYFNLSTDSNTGDAAPDTRGWRGAILRVSPDGSQVERFATGQRFAYGLAFDHQGGLFFTDNHGGQNPTEELNHAVPGGFYGHNPVKWPDHPAETPPLVEVQTGVALTGLRFNPPSINFGGHGGDLFVACWGPDFHFDRGSIIRIHLAKQADGSYRATEHLFAHEIPKATDLVFSSQGDLYVALFGKEQFGHLPADRPEGAIYRIMPADWVTPTAGNPSRFPLVKGDVSAGGRLFVERTCANCHSLDPAAEMLGPDLAGLGDIYTVPELLTMIRKPSQGIKSGYETERITLINGENIEGRMASSSATEITLFLPGNHLNKIRRSDIKSQATLPASLMPEGLLDGLTDNQINDLLAYLGARDRSRGWFLDQLFALEFALQPYFPSLRFRTKLVLGGVFLAAILIPVLFGLRHFFNRRRWTRNSASIP